MRKIFQKMSIGGETFPYHMLPAWALFRLKPQRELVKLSYKIPKFSDGNAYFDAETGILLYYHTLWGNNKDNKIFFILSEINFDFAARKAYAEDNGPHTGFKSIVSEQAPIFGGGSVVIQSLVETRYGNTVEMTVLTSIIGSSGASWPTSEHFCFFGDIPEVRHKSMEEAGTLPPENWDPYGQYLWWWIPSNTLQGADINVLDVPMSRMVADAHWVGEDPITFSATEFPLRFYFSELIFGGDGYLIRFSAKDPLIGLDVRQDNLFQNGTTVTGLDYYRTIMGTATPSRPSAFNKVSPANVATIPPINPTLSWGNSPGAASYEYCYDKTNNTTCDGNWTTTGSNNSVILSGLDKGSTYYWQVRALNDFGSMDADGGNWWEFTISSNFYLYLPMILR